MRFGYTTGSCAVAASKAAAIMLLSHKTLDSVCLMTPKGIDLNLEINDIQISENKVKCAIKKDSGDDPDVTNGILIYSEVELIQENEILIDGGIGIGRVTKPGLNQPVGAAAINSVPRQMICRELNSVREEFSYDGGFSVTVSAPEGVEIAKKTYNSRLGIIGGISILGTSGIVDPMSDSAIIDTIKAEINLKNAAGRKYLLLTPGNYGEDYLKSAVDFESVADDAVKTSNFIGNAIDYGADLGFCGILLVGHIGKIVKLAGGLFNTHSKYGDCRGEIFAAHSILSGADACTAKSILNCVTTDEMIAEIDKAGLRDIVFESLMKRIKFNLNARVFEKIDVGAVTFSQKYGFLGMTDNAENLLNKIKGEL